ncbi:PTS glucose transporter subunit IIA, partial [Staphylococcus warneri]
LISENDNVEIGQTLLRFNQTDIEKQGYNTITPIIITNSDDFEEILIEDKNEVTDRDNIMTIIKK